MVNRATPIATPVETIYDVNLILDKGSKLRTKSSNPAIAILAMFQTDSPYDSSIPTLVLMTFFFHLNSYSQGANCQHSCSSKFPSFGRVN